MTLSHEAIELRGGRQHNLKNIDVRIPLRKLTVVCGVSGSGKSSLALDTLHAEGQRRFVECFSASARQHLQRWSKPELEFLSALPPSIAIVKRPLPQSLRALVGTVTECADYLRILFANCAQLHCYRCQSTIEPNSPASVSQWISEQDAGLEAILVAAIAWESKAELSEQLGALQAEGYVRLILSERMWHLGRDDRQELAESVGSSGNGWIAIDRFRGGKQTTRTVESLESAFAMSERPIALLTSTMTSSSMLEEKSKECIIDGKAYCLRWCPRGRICLQCDLEYPDPVPALFHFNSPLGACPQCHGTGKSDVDGPTITKNPGRTESRTRRACPACGGKRFQPMALAYTVQGKSIADLLGESVDGFSVTLNHWQDLGRANAAMQDAMHQIQNRIQFLREVGLGYLGLDRPIHTLSTGEAQRVALTSILSSDLTNMLYVLDEPTTGLHPIEVPKLVSSLQRLRDRGNTVVVIEHASEVMRQADWIIEMGPEAGRGGGHVLYSGTFEHWLTQGTTSSELVSVRNHSISDDAVAKSLTASVRARSKPSVQTSNGDGIRLMAASGNNLQSVDLFVPLHKLCVVTGVSGSGKSSLIEDTLYPALAEQLQMPHVEPLPFREVSGYDGIDELVFLGKDDYQKQTKSHPVSLVKALDPIRQLFAEQPEARIRNWGHQRFSFHHPSGRCLECDGTGIAVIDMQFLSDVQLACPVCQGTRYQEEVLSIHYRQRNIAEVLAMPAIEAMPFFRGHGSIQEKLAILCDYDLGHVPLGQATETLSHGEMQRLRLAAKVQANARSHTLFLLDEPTTGLHPFDVKRLMERLNKLRQQGHSFLLIENEPLVLQNADYLIELGPGSAERGGRIVRCGTPAEMMGDSGTLSSSLLHGFQG